MRLESAMFASKEGLAAHGQALSVVGDNVANVNTTGYKASRAEFLDLLAEGTGGFQSTTLPGAGGGATLGGVRQIHEVGSIEFTGRALDVAIEGNGFFLVGDAVNPSYTRAGNFQIDANGVLTTAEGLPVLGYSGNDTATLGQLNMLSVTAGATPTTAALLNGNMNSATPVTTLPNNPQTFDQIGALASYVTSMDVFDSLGERHSVTMAFFKTGVNTWTAQAYMDGSDVGGAAGAPVQIGQAAQLNFSDQGVIEEGNQAAAIITANPAYANGAAAGNFTIDLSQFTQLGSPSVLENATQDGIGAGDLASYSISGDGQIIGLLDTGQEVLIGSIPLATFVNVDGLRRSGSTLFVEGDTSGERTLGLAGTGQLGDLSGSALERSTVDIANQFVDMVLYQRGYQANSQVLRTASTIIEQTLNLIR